MRPRLKYAVSSGCSVLQKSLQDASCTNADSDTKGGEGERCLRVFFVGHSLGGMVALQTALTAAKYMPDIQFGSTRAYVAGFCTLNGAVDSRQAEQCPEAFEVLSHARALLIAGDADAVVPPEATEDLYRALPIAAKRHLIMPGAEHDLYTCKQELLDELESFLTADLRQ